MKRGSRGVDTEATGCNDEERIPKLRRSSTNVRDARTAVSGQLRVSLENRKDDARQPASQPVAEEVNPPRNLQPALTRDASSSELDDYDTHQRRWFPEV